jgi:hypothetical protein
MRGVFSVQFSEGKGMGPMGLMKLAPELKSEGRRTEIRKKSEGRNPNNPTGAGR